MEENLYCNRKLHSSLRKCLLGRLKVRYAKTNCMAIDCGVLDLEIILAPVLPPYRMLAHKEQILFCVIFYALIININKHCLLFNRFEAQLYNCTNTLNIAFTDYSIIRSLWVSVYSLSNTRDCRACPFQGILELCDGRVII